MSVADLSAVLQPMKTAKNGWTPRLKLSQLPHNCRETMHKPLKTVKFGLIILLMSWSILILGCWDTGLTTDEEQLKTCRLYCNLLFQCLDQSIDYSQTPNDCANQCEQDVNDDNPFTPNQNIMYCTNFKICSEFGKCIESVLDSE